MAKYEYKPLGPAKRKSANARWLILALVVIIVGAMVLMKTRGGDPGVQGTDLTTDGGEATSTYAMPAEPANPTPRPAQENTAAAAPPTRTDAAVPPAPAPSPAAAPTNAPPAVFNIPAPTTTTMSDATLNLIEKALKQLQSGYVVAARDSLNTALGMDMTPEYRASVKKKMAELAQNWLFSKTVFPGDTLTEMYTVRPGEVLTNIGRRFNVPYEMLMQINGISRPELLQAGQKIKVVSGPLHVKVYRSTFTMDLYLGSQMYVKSYKVGLGAVDSATPTGRWRVRSGGKAIKPMWTNPRTGKTYRADDPEYPLGSRYIELEGLDPSNKDITDIAIHGTKDPQSIGTRLSLGCIRLYNGDAIEVYNLLTEQKSEVRIVD